MFSDLRFAIRVLLHAKGWTAVVVISLALGIGANTALFSAASGLLLRKIPVKDPDSLVRLRYAGQNDMMTGSSDYGQSAGVAGDDYGLPVSVDGQRVRTTFSYPMVQEFRSANQTMTDLTASAPYGRLNLIADGRAELASAFICSGNYYQLLGLNAIRGRLFTIDDDRLGAPPVVVISYGYWARRFTNDPAAVGKVIRVGGLPVTIIGVLPPEFTGTERPGGEAPDVALPLALDPLVAQELRDRDRMTRPTEWWLQVMGRLKPGVTARQVQANLDPVFRSAARSGLDSYLASLPQEARLSARNRGRTNIPRLIVQPAARGLTDINQDDERTVSVLGAVVLLMLLIVCANVANLLLARASTRQREIAVRLSMGASRARLVLQLLIESVFLAAIGGAVGIFVAGVGLRLLPVGLSRAASLNWRVLLFALGATMATGIAFGILPALRATGVDVTAALKEQSRSVVRSRSYAGKILLITQVAISLVLLVGAGVFLRTIANLRHIDLGFNASNLVVLDVDPQHLQIEPQRFESFYREVADRVGRIPGVTHVSYSRNGLLSGTLSDTDIFLSGRDYPGGGGSDTNIARLIVAPTFFDTMQIPLMRGRLLSAGDSATSPKVAVINQAAAGKFFPDADPIGRRFGESVEQSSEVEVVGVVRDAKYSSLRGPAPPTVYLPFAQSRPSNVVFELRTARDPMSLVPEVREVIRGAYPDLPIINMTTQQARIEQRFAQERVVAHAYLLFGGLALVLACIGLFGLMSYNVSQRTSEIGIRMALGADRQSVLRGVMSESMSLAFAGVALGIVAAIAAGKFIESLLFGVSASDVVSMAVAAAVLLIVSALAAFIPARRASRVDPMVALRYE